MSNYSQHVAKLQQRFSTALITHNYSGALIYSGHQHYAFADDNSYPFRVNPYFKYWLPLTGQQSSYLWIEPGCKPHLFLHQIEDYWHAQPVVPEGEWQQLFDLTVISHADEVKSVLGNKLVNAAYMGEAKDNAVHWGVEVNPTGLVAYLDYHRAYKTAYEIDCLQKANDIAAIAHKAAEKAFYAGCSELQIHQAYTDAIRVRESHLPYNNIIALNEAGSVLHYDHYQTKAPAKSLSFLIDAGADYQGYAADISRNYVIEGEEHAEYRAMFDAYAREYYGLLDEIALNKPYFDFHDSAHRRMAKLLSEFDIVNVSADEAYDKGYSRMVFPCGTGHYIGLQVHDVGGYLANENGDMLAKDERYPFLRLNRPMESGIVFTVEPGIYFIDMLLKDVQGSSDINWSRLEQLKPYGGFRMEDCIAMTDTGYINLSQNGFDKL